MTVQKSREDARIFYDWTLHDSMLSIRILSKFCLSTLHCEKKEWNVLHLNKKNERLNLVFPLFFVKKKQIQMPFGWIPFCASVYCLCACENIVVKYWYFNLLQRNRNEMSKTQTAWSWMCTEFRFCWLSHALN